MRGCGVRKRCVVFGSRELAIVFALIGLVGSAHADFICSSELSYKWVKSFEGSSAPSAGEKEGEKGGGEAAGKVTQRAEPSVVKLMAVERPGADEATAKEALQAEVVRQRVRVSELCKREHEAFGECVAGKLSHKASLLNSLSFSVREEVQKGLVNECKERSGTCLSVEVSDPKCREVVVAKPPEAASDPKKGDAKKGDAKKK